MFRTGKSYNTGRSSTPIRKAPVAPQSKRKPKIDLNHLTLLTILPNPKGFQHLTPLQSFLLSMLLLSFYLPECEIQTSSSASSGKSDNKRNYTTPNATEINSSTQSIPSLEHVKTNTVLPRPTLSNSMQTDKYLLIKKSIIASSSTQPEFFSKDLKKRSRHQPNHKGVPAENITGRTQNCSRLSSLSTLHRVCLIDGDTWYLKSTQIEGQNSLQGYYNILFARDVIGIKVPEIKYTVEMREGFFFGKDEIIEFASKEIDNYINGIKIFNPHFSCSWGWDHVAVRKSLVEKIGESGLAKLIVASIFFLDLHGSNWGIANSELVLIDIDRSPQYLDDYLTGVAGETPFDFSLNTISEMYMIFQSMYNKPLPKIHESVDMTEERHHSLLEIYSSICREVLYKGQVAGLNPKEPSRKINQLWIEAQKERAHDHLSSAERSSTCYVGLI